MNYDVDYFLAKFEAIPEDQWCTSVTTDLRGRHCAYGHCSNAGENAGLCDLMHEGGLKTSTVNDGGDPFYQQPTPRQRILAALRDIKKARLT